MIILIAMLSFQSMGKTWSLGLDNTIWVQQPSIFGCRFIQPIDGFGQAVFFREAGESLIFQLETDNNPMRAGQAALTIEAPEWRSAALTQFLGYVPVVDAMKPIEVMVPNSEIMLQALQQGMAPTLTREAKYGDDSARVRLSPVNFGRYLPEFEACIAQLLPVNFRQVERVAVYFDPSQDALDAEAKAQLDLIALYVANDPKVLAIYIEGHTDDQGTRYENRRLSETRAYKVEDYLVLQGVDPNLLYTDYHGERYPVADNSTASGRAKNRRVTLRMERIFGDADDPLLGLYGPTP